MKTILKNIISPTPAGWKKLRNIAVAAMTLSIAIVYSPPTLFTIPKSIVDVANVVIYVGLTLGITAQAQKKETPKI